MLDQLFHLEHGMGRIYNEPLRSFAWPVPEAQTAAWLPTVDIYEEPDVVYLLAELPGVKPEDAIDSSSIKASHDLGVLTITLPKAEAAKLHQIKVEVVPENALLTA
jgi:HSP20 family molecular chaperone IbpA